MTVESDVGIMAVFRKLEVDRSFLISRSTREKNSKVDEKGNICFLLFSWYDYDCLLSSPFKDILKYIALS
jgi:hypothetical protein